MKVCIVGGGSSGWMTATTFCRKLDYDITLVESPDVPISGVGESTLHQFQRWIDFVGIREDEDDFIRETGGTIKHAIMFTNFLQKNSGSFFYPFGLSPKDPSSWWSEALRTGLDHNDYATSINHIATIAAEGKVDPNSDYAYHFDAVKYGQFLKNRYCQKVKHISANVVNYVTTDEVNIHSIVLDDGSEIEADLFIDCTGFKSLLLGEWLEEKFHPYDFIPNDTAITARLPYYDKEKEMVAYTECTAMDNGWTWKIPLWDYWGTGYVYSSKYVSHEDAALEFKNHYGIEPQKFVPMKIGRYENTWVNNVVAIGLSAGFIEPLESNGLLNVHDNLIKLAKTLRRGPASTLLKQMYNADVRREMDQTADFIAIHYAFSQRNHTPYWRDAINREYDLDRIGYYGMRAFSSELYEQSRYTHPEGGFHYIASGMNICPLTEPVCDYTSDVEKWKDAIKQLPTPYLYLQEKYQALQHYYV